MSCAQSMTTCLSGAFCYKSVLGELKHKPVKVFRLSSLARNLSSRCTHSFWIILSAMKHRLSFLRLLGVFCVVLASVRLGYSKPGIQEINISPPLNCCNSSVWTSENQARDLSGGINIKMPGSVWESPLPASNTPSYAFSKSTEDYGTGAENGYFDYYYEEPETFSNVQQSAGSWPTGEQHQRPPGLSRVAKLKLIKTPRRQPPEYMLELYDRFSRVAATPVTTPAARGQREEDNSDLGADIVRSFPNINKEDDVTPDGNDDPAQEDEQLPGHEARYHTLVFNITSLLTGEEVSRAELRLYTLVEHDRNTYVGDDRVVTVYEGLSIRHHPPVATRHVYGHSGGWEAFDVTSVVRKWVSKESRTVDGVHVLEVSIDSVFQNENPGSVDIDVDPEHNEGPLLVVFSRDTSSHLQQELQALIAHEPAAEDVPGISISPGTVREKRDSAQQQPLLRAARATSWRQQSRRDPFYLTATAGNVQVPLKRVRRDKRKRNSCKRKPLYVDFQDINWHQWIIAPQGYMAFECVGKCFYPLGAHLSPTNHAIIQTLVHTAHEPKRAARVCCVPTKLDPISILYLDENNVITYKYHYDGMVAAECGCR